MKILVAIDDTDNIESRGTGELAEILSQSLKEKGWGHGGPVTRHQMLIHPDIPYTSHNSAMCFSADMVREKLQEFTSFSKEFLNNESAHGSDPGLCIADMERIATPKDLMAFGHSAKKVVLSKDDAYSLAKHVDVHLSEHGGTGQGVIGAIAGVGLRMTGNDGRFKGHFRIKPPGEVVTVRDIKRHTGIDHVKSLEGYCLRDSEKVLLGEKVKAVLLENKAIILVFESDGNGNNGIKWQTCTKQQLRKF